ncbi:hypothetical protein [Streptomyces sp. NPDC096339]|uniref:hypothetical protein n=1 Tax=Streptomyces sp. NPDC096339 TaxID=3366086 RepID=UPI0037F75148
MVADPEEIGDLLRRTLRGHVLVPMTVLNATYAAEIFDALDTGSGLDQLVLHVDPDTLGTRIAASEERPGDETRSESVRADRRRRAPDYTTAGETCMYAPARSSRPARKPRTSSCKPPSITGHGDLHWGNLTPAPQVILDWEDWILRVTGRGSQPELAPHLARLAQYPTGTPVPAPTPIA